MRNFLTVVGALVVIALGYWAYSQNIQTQQAIRAVERLQRNIVVERERLAMLRVEGAYLNSPGRPRELVDLNFERLNLFPMTPDQFAVMDEVIWRPDTAPAAPAAPGAPGAPEAEAEGMSYTSSRPEVPQ